MTPDDERTLVELGDLAPDRSLLPSTAQGLSSSADSDAVAVILVDQAADDHHLKPQEATGDEEQGGLTQQQQQQQQQPQQHQQLHDHGWQAGHSQQQVQDQQQGEDSSCVKTKVADISNGSDDDHGHDERGQETDHEKDQQLRHRLPENEGKGSDSSSSSNNNKVKAEARGIGSLEVPRVENNNDNAVAENIEAEDEDRKHKGLTVEGDADNDHDGRDVSKEVGAGSEDDDKEKEKEKEVDEEEAQEEVILLGCFQSEEAPPVERPLNEGISSWPAAAKAKTKAKAKAKAPAPPPPPDYAAATAAAATAAAAAAAPTIAATIAASVSHLSLPRAPPGLPEPSSQYVEVQLQDPSELSDDQALRFDVRLTVDEDIGAGIEVTFLPGRGYLVEGIAARPGQPSLRVGDVLVGVVAGAPVPAVAPEDSRATLARWAAGEDGEGDLADAAVFATLSEDDCDDALADAIAGGSHLLVERRLWQQQSRQKLQPQLQPQQQQQRPGEVIADEVQRSIQPASTEEVCVHTQRQGQEGEEDEEEGTWNEDRGSTENLECYVFGDPSISGPALGQASSALSSQKAREGELAGEDQTEATRAMKVGLIDEEIGPQSRIEGTGRRWLDSSLEVDGCDHVYEMAGASICTEVADEAASAPECQTESHVSEEADKSTCQDEADRVCRDQLLVLKLPQEPQGVQPSKIVELGDESDEESCGILIASGPAVGSTCPPPPPPTPPSTIEVPSSTTARATMTSRSMCKVGGLAEWLHQLRLEEYFEEASHWCSEMGAVTLEEVAENIEDFAADVRLKPIEAQRVRKWATKVTAATTDGGIGRADGWNGPHSFATPTLASGQGLSSGKDEATSLASLRTKWQEGEARLRGTAASSSSSPSLPSSQTQTRGGDGRGPGGGGSSSAALAASAAAAAAAVEEAKAAGVLDQKAPSITEFCVPRYIRLAVDSHGETGRGWLRKCGRVVQKNQGLDLEWDWEYGCFVNGVDPLPGQPGIEVGDYIVAIDGASLRRKSVEDCSGLFQAKLRNGVLVAVVTRGTGIKVDKAKEECKGKGKGCFGPPARPGQNFRLGGRRSGYDGRMMWSRFRKPGW